MSQAENMALPIEGQISRSELLEIKNTMNTRALAKRRGRTALRLTANVLFAFVVLLPLLYAVSIAFMPSSELFTTELNILPKHPTWSNFINAFTSLSGRFQFSVEKAYKVRYFIPISWAAWQTVSTFLAPTVCP